MCDKTDSLNTNKKWSNFTTRLATDLERKILKLSQTFGVEKVGSD